MAGEDNRCSLGKGGFARAALHFRWCRSFQLERVLHRVPYIEADLPDAIHLT